MTPGPAGDDDLLWTPSPERAAAARVTEFRRWVAAERGVVLDDERALWHWSVDALEDFWGAVWEWSGVRADVGPSTVLPGRDMPGARWFPGAAVSWAAHALRGPGREPDDEALVAVREDGRRVALSWAELRRQVRATAAGLQALGVRRGDTVAAVLPAAEHAVVALLATASIGATWTSCSPDFGVGGVVDRIGQSSPRVLLGVDGYLYGGRRHDVADRLLAVAEALPERPQVVVVPYLDEGASPPEGAQAWASLLAHDQAPPAPWPVPLPVDHPLWVLYSSGTTGLPKAIVHGQGGVLVEHLKVLGLHCDLGPASRFCWFTTTGWMMWNFLVGGLLVGATVVTYDGSPVEPDAGALWRLAADERLTFLGASAPYLAACADRGLRPGDDLDLAALRSVGSTGAPLSPLAARWVLDAVSPDVHLADVSGGTDVCSAFVAGFPTLPVHAGRMQSRALGAAVAALSPDGEPLVDEVGELALLAPLPSMPVGLVGDDDGSRLRATWFDVWPGVWRHGDWCRVLPTGEVVISGRSDATLNRGGVRIGTAELYRVVEAVPEVDEALVVDTSAGTTTGELLLFVVLAPGVRLDDALVGSLRARLRADVSPRHVPDRVVAVPAVPHTRNGKKLEVPVKRLLAGEPVERAVALASVADPASLEPFVALGRDAERES